MHDNEWTRVVELVQDNLSADGKIEEIVVTPVTPATADGQSFTTAAANLLAAIEAFRASVSLRDEVPLECRIRASVDEMASWLQTYGAAGPT